MTLYGVVRGVMIEIREVGARYGVSSSSGVKLVLTSEDRYGVLVLIWNGERPLEALFRCPQ